MEIQEYAEMILRGASLRDKLHRPEVFSDSFAGNEKLIPSHPNRSPLISLSKKYNQKKSFPNKNSLHLAENRGRVLHFFANHELLALELMALVLLRFPKAPKAFRLGIAKTMLEEQEHLQLYLSRMNQLGIGFGEEHLNDFFWKCLAGVKSPIEFTAKMSLTLEQGNLDFSFYYWKLFESLEDHKTSAILEQVYRDEIGHVKHGIHWFRKFKYQANLSDKSDWEIYTSLLDKPLSPMRAKGLTFVRQARIDADLDSEFIEQIEHYQGSKGRPPSIWIFNPNFEEQIVHPNKTFPSTRKLVNDLSTILLCLANEHDLVLTNRPPSKQFLLGLKKLGLKIPNFIDKEALKTLRGPVSRIKPWGWSYEIYKDWSKRYQSLTDEHIHDKEWLQAGNYDLIPLGRLTSKVWGVKVQEAFIASLDLEQKKMLNLRAIESHVCNSLAEFTEARTNIKALDFKEILVKAPYGSSGRNQRKIDCSQALLENEINWLKNTIKTHGKVIVEPYLNTVLDLSVQIMIHDDSSSSILGVTRFLTHKNRSYFGHVLGKKLFDCDENITKAVFQKPKKGLSHWELLKKCASYVSKQLQSTGYRGPAGMDAFIFKQGSQFYLKPLVEVNCRYTMGHCALALEKYLPRDWIGLFSIKQKKNLNSTVHPIEQTFPLAQMKQLNHSNMKLKASPAAGRLFLNDPKSAESLIANLVIIPSFS